MRSQIVLLCRVIRETKNASHGVPRFSRITISRRCRHDTRYAHAFHRAEAIFRSNMIIKSKSGIRNSSEARILSASSPPLCQPCRLLRSIRVFARMGQGMRFAVLFFFSLPLLSLSFQVYRHRYPRVGGIEKPKESIAKKTRWQKKRII